MAAADEQTSNVEQRHRWSRAEMWRHRSVLLVALPILGACLAVVILVIPALTGVGIVYHSTCALGPEVGFLPNYPIPAVLVNSPYGGSGWGNGTVPITFPGATNGPPPQGVFAVGFGAGALNGASLGAFFTVNVSIYSVRNSTEFGAGESVTCSQGYSIQFENPSTYAEAGGQIMGANNTSDALEPRFATFDPGLVNSSDVLHFNNSFSTENSQVVTTCDEPARSFPIVESGFLHVWFPVHASTSFMVPFELTFVQTFHYIFPANFGSWEVDNLSAPGGPGGGWAFSYLPCT